MTARYSRAVSFWWWVLLYGAITVAALVTYAVIGLGLWRRTKQLSADIARLSQLMATAPRAVGPVEDDEWVAAAARQPTR